MKKYLKKIALALVVIFIGIQFIPTKLNLSDTISSSDFIEIYKAPQNIQKIIKTSCYDCHSNNTNYPWYSKIQPAAWFMESHINEGKEELNFSTFGDYSNRRKKGKFKSIISQIKDDEMPLWSYTLIHRNAALTKGDKLILNQWLNKIKDSLK